MKPRRGEVSHRVVHDLLPNATGRWRLEMTETQDSV